MMKKIENIVQEIVVKSAVWVADSDSENLAKIASDVLKTGVGVISVSNGFVDKVWPWVEKANVKIINRYYFSPSTDGEISSFATDITNGFHKGASGTQVFVDMVGLEKLVPQLLPIRDDLFFDKDFIIALDISDISDDMWYRFFELVKKIKPTGILVTASGDVFDAKSDFVGRIFAMLENWDADAGLQIMFGKNNLRIIQTIRLVQKKYPKLSSKILVYTTDLAV